MAKCWDHFWCAMRKNIMIRYQQKLWLVLELLGPPLIFLPFAFLIDTKSVAEPTCFHETRPLPTAGLGNFLEGMWCSVQDNCSLVPHNDSDLGTVAEKHLFRTYIRKMAAFISNDSAVFDPKEPSDLLQNTSCVQQNILKVLNQTLSLRDYLLNKAQFRQRYSPTIPTHGIFRPQPHNLTDKIDCSKGKFKIRNGPILVCQKILQRTGVTGVALYQLFTLLHGYILVTPNTPVVRKIVHRARNYLKSMKTGQALLKDSLILLKKKSVDPPYVDEHTPLKPLISVLAACLRLEDRFVMVDSEEELEEIGTCLIDRYLYFSGLVFIDKPKKSLPKLTKFKIRMANFLVDPTDRLSDFTWQDYYTRNKTGNYSKMLYFGFVFIQDLIERAIIEHHSGERMKLGMFTHEFPETCYRLRRFDNVFQFLMPCFMFLVWIFGFLSLVKNIVEEKETRLKEIMKLLGLHGFIYVFTWFIQALIVSMVAGSLLLIVLTVGGIFQRANPFILLLFLFLSIFALLTEALLFSTLFTSASVASVVSCFCFIFSYAPAPYFYTVRSSLTYLEKLFSCFITQLAVSWGTTILVTWEEEGSGIQWWNLNRESLLFDKLDFESVLVVLATNSAIHLLLYWYIDAVFPGRYGIPRRFYFFVKPSYYWRDVFGCKAKKGKATRSQSLDTSETESDGRFSLEGEPKNMKLGVSICNLSKEYKKGKLVVNKLNVNFYESQITSFLGHNGAGKTTTMSVLSGLYPPTSGTAYIYGYDIRTEFDSARPFIGLCPQYNILFEKLTVEEQLWFYSKLKGSKGKQMKAEIEEILDSVGLKLKRHQLAGSLSGGMKRRLCIAVAFLGGTKTVILDEPTAGIDPQYRRDIWDLLLKYKPGRTIILSTHHMDEADVLGDRIAIIKSGHLLCCGSSLYLKKKFGSGYQMTVVLDPSLFSPNSLSELEVADVTANSIMTSPIDTKSVSQSVSQEVDAPKTNSTQISSEKEPSSETVQDVTNIEVKHAMTNTEPQNNESSLQTARYTRTGDDQMKCICEVFNQLLPGSRFMEKVAQEATFILSTKNPSRLRPFLIKFDQIKGSLGIKTYGMADTSMEQIFLKVTGYQEQDEPLAPQPPNFFARLFRKKAKTIETQLKDKKDRIPLATMTRPVVGHVKFIRAYRFKALLIKRFHNFMANFFSTVAALLLTVLMVLFSVILVISIQKSSPNQKSVLMSPWITANKELPNTIFLSSEPPMLSNVSQFVRSEPYFNAKSCPSTYPQGFGCAVNQKHPSKPVKAPYTISEKMCNCKNGQWQCPFDAYHPIPNRVLTAGHDQLVDMSNRNLSQWLLLTFEKYRIHRFGGYSVGKVDFDAFTDEEIENLTFIWNRKYVEYDKFNPANCTNCRHLKLQLLNKTTRMKLLDQFFHNLDTKNNLKVWYSSLLWPSVPIYLNTFNNIILRYLKGSSDYGILLYNHPIKFSKIQQEVRQAFVIYDNFVNQVQPAMISFAYCILPATFAIFLIQERVTGAKRMQILCGVRPWLYWINNFVWDYCWYLILVLFTMVIFVSFNVDAYVATPGVAGATMLLLVFYGFGTIPLFYAFTFLFDQPSFAFCFLAVVNLVMGNMLASASLIIDIKFGWNINGKVAKIIFSFFPSFCLNRGLLDMSLDDSTYKAQVAYEGKKYAKHKNPFEYSFLGRAYLAFLLQFLFGWTLLFLIEYRRKIFKHRSSKLLQLIEPIDEDEDSVVIRERRTVQMVEKERQENRLRVDELCKVYQPNRGKKFLAVNKISFTVAPGECFGLLGINGAGKTTTFKMLTGDEEITAGDAFCGGNSVKTNTKSAHRLMGYCPQTDALNLSLNSYQHLYLYARLRGIKENDLKKIADWMISHMQLNQYANIAAEKYSGGNRRKLSTAIALIGEPSVVLLDEPSAGMDPKTRRFMWNRVLDLVRLGKSVVLTSHSMEECEALCNRLAIMVQGRFKCLGSVQQLKSKFGQHVILLIQLNRDTTQQDMRNFNLFMENELKVAELTASHGTSLQYQVATNKVNLPDIFGVLERAYVKFRIDDYSLTQASLDDIFIRFARQRNVGPHSQRSFKKES